MMSLKIASPLYMIYLLVISGALGKGWSVTYMQQNLCALKGSTVFMNGSYTYPTYFTVTKTFWLINPFEGKDTGLLNEADYSGRVEYLGDERNHFSLRLSDVRERDQNEYYFRIRANEDKWFGKPGVTLNVTDLQLIAPAEVTEGQSAILTCKTTCSLTHQTFIWYKNGHDLTTKTTKSNNVYLQPVSSEDSGSYSCAVRGYEHLRTPAKSLVVRYPPKNVSVSINPSGEIVEGSSVNLTCSSDANPDVKKYEWYKGAALVGREKTYTISKIIFKDSGQFKCSCSNEVGHQDSNSVTLNVLYPPRSVSVSISPTGEVVEGSSVTLTCSSDANPPVENYEWYKGTKSVGKVKSYTISSITSEDSGEYKCKSSNEVGHQNSSSITLNVLYTPKNVSVSISPTGEIVEGSSVTLTCSSDANPPVENYEWYKGTKSVGKVKSYTISSITSEDSGEYKCKSSNEVGHQNSSSITLNVLYPPRSVSVSISPTGEIVEGSSVTLTCSSDANPPVENYEWYKGTKSVGKAKSYTISSITSEDSGEYKCKSSNEVGHQNSSSITLNVLYTPKNVSVSISPTGEIVEGSSVTLTCSSDANPPVENYEWYKGTKSIGKVKSYTISSITSEDSGEYKCKSSNEVGHQNSSSITLNVLYPPKNVSVSISPTGEIVEDSSVTLTCSSDANPPVEIYTWFKVNESSAVGSGQSYRALQSGQYYCEAQNKHGSERSAAVPVTIHSDSLILYVSVGIGLFGLAALLSTLFWLRWKRQKKKADEGDHQNAGPSAKDDTYAALDLTGRTSDDVYHTLTAFKVTT